MGDKSRRWLLHTDTVGNPTKINKGYLRSYLGLDAGGHMVNPEDTPDLTDTCIRHCTLPVAQAMLLRPERWSVDIYEKPWGVDLAAMAGEELAEADEDDLRLLYQTITGEQP